MADNTGMDAGCEGAKPGTILPMAGQTAVPKGTCCGGFPEERPPGTELKQAFVVGSIKTPAGDIPLVSTSLSIRDHLGTFKARWGIGRMHYRVAPGLYAVGRPGRKSPILVTANYKMSFDSLRSRLDGRDAWILVLDTKGINVWCAAGKGTFGTDELVGRIQATKLRDLVEHRDLILPQLSAPGVAAHLVKKLSGFRVRYGPIKASDLPFFLDHGYKAEPSMRLKTFTTWERLVLIPVELVGALKGALVLAAVFSLLSGFLGPRGFVSNLSQEGLFACAGILFSLLAGAVLTPLLLPWLPGRAFSLKGALTGLAAALVMVLMRAPELNAWPARIEVLAWALLVPALAAYLGMNFTGASSYTSLSGVKKEMKWAVPLEAGGGIAGLVLWVGALLVKT